MAKYKNFGNIPMEKRTWPDRVIEKAPIWCSVDLRDGNQALANPMGIEQKLKFFGLLVNLGFKQIEVGFPSASETEYAFIRRLIDENRIPPDVTIQVLTQARSELIRRTFEAIQGAKKVIFHLYSSTSPAHRKFTFNMTKEEVVQIAVGGVKAIKNDLPMARGIDLTLEYSPESFSCTEIDFALEVCEGVKKEWGFASGEKIILNLPTTVECATPNVHADQIEYFCNHISGRDKVIVSLHNHNDRGEGVASCELSLLAGADRVEGTLFGNGERTGNLDIVTVALNMYSQGVTTGLDFSHIADVADAYTRLTSMPVHPRHPYAGELVFTAFSGSHQDAIRKGMAARKGMAQDAPWEVPYLAIDPRDIGREYQEIIRINSQSGKGGSAWILEQDFGIFLPKAMQPALGALVTRAADKAQRELEAREIYDIFMSQWIGRTTPLKIIDIAETHLEKSASQTPQVFCRAVVEWHGKQYAVGKAGNGPLDAFVAALCAAFSGTDFSPRMPVFTISAFHEHSVGTGSDTDAMAYVEITLETGQRLWGCGKSSNIGRAGIEAVVSAVNQMA
jgi:2-isopropylmalate synthase